MKNSHFSWGNFGMVLALTVLAGIGAYAVAWQFNDGQMTRPVIGSVFLACPCPACLSAA